MTEPFDIIFVDMEFSSYRSVVEQILDKGLLASDGIILVDNGASCQPQTNPASTTQLTFWAAVFARGFAVDSENVANIDSAKTEHWTEAGSMVREFNTFVASDARICVTMLPFFDGISEIRMKTANDAVKTLLDP